MKIVGIIMGVLIAADLHSQICPGSLGDPIINRTFGAGTNPGAPLLAATTTYQYVPTNCPNDGFYSVLNSFTGCFGSTWHSLASDHTGDPGGYFMLVNASFQPSAFYVDTVRGLCSGTTYEFASWIANVLAPWACSGNGIQPNLTFTLEKTDGTVIQTFNTGIIPVTGGLVWKQFGFFFTMPVNVNDVVVRIYNNAPGGCGNDLALDDITFRPCGPLTQASILGQSTDSVTSCEGNAVSFTFDAVLSAGYINPAFQWQERINGGAWADIPGAVTMTYNRNFPVGTPTGVYAFRFSAAEAGNLNLVQCRVVSKPLIISIAANPVTSAKSNAPICENNLLQLTATGGTIYQWNGPNNFTANSGTVSIGNTTTQQSGKYYVLATTAEGCSTLDSVTVSINPAPSASTSFPDITICEGETVQLVGSGGIGYEWRPASGLSSPFLPNPLASPADTVNYQLIVSNQFGCRDTAEVLVNVIERPEAKAGPDRIIMKGSTVELSGSLSGQNLNYKWFPPVFINNTGILQPIVNPPRDTIYVLTVESRDGCGIDSDSVKVIVYQDVFVPTAFTPNNDGLNDRWFIPALSAFTTFTLSVYDRYGQMVFQNKNSNRPWDGKYNGEPLPIGVYVYVLDLRQSGRIIKGVVSILR